MLDHVGGRSNQTRADGLWEVAQHHRPVAAALDTRLRQHQVEPDHVSGEPVAAQDAIDRRLDLAAPTDVAQHERAVVEIERRGEVGEHPPALAGRGGDDLLAQRVVAGDGNHRLVAMVVVVLLLGQHSPHICRVEVECRRQMRGSEPGAALDDREDLLGSPVEHGGTHECPARSVHEARRRAVRRVVRSGRRSPPLLAAGSEPSMLRAARRSRTPSWRSPPSPGRRHRRRTGRRPIRRLHRRIPAFAHRGADRPVGTDRSAKATIAGDGRITVRRAGSTSARTPRAPASRAAARSLTALSPKCRTRRGSIRSAAATLTSNPSALPSRASDEVTTRSIAATSNPVADTTRPS